jgi:hypothetical protein
MNTPDVIATPAAKPAANEPDIGAAVVALSKTKEALRAPADMVDAKGRRIKPFGSVFHE